MQAEAEYYPKTLKNIVTGLVTDDGYPLATNLNKSDLTTNTNKSVVIQLLTRSDEVYFLYVRSGRVGYGGTVTVDCFINKNQAIEEFKKQFEERTDVTWDKRFDVSPNPSKYTFIATRTAVKDDVVIEKKKDAIDMGLIHLMGLIYDNEELVRFAQDNRIDQKKLPLGSLSKKHLDAAAEILNKIKGVTDRQVLLDLNSQFYSMIPTNTGTKAPKLIETEADIIEKHNLLEDLGYISYLEKSSREDVITQYKRLGTNITHVTDPEVIREINNYLVTNRGGTHNIGVNLINLYQLDKPSETELFKQYENLHNRQLLWHGTRIANVVGILSTRFQLNPSAVITGKMFGNGVYFANASTKSAGYIGTNKDNIGFMFLCEIALGTPKKETNAVSYTGKPVGYDSVHGVGQWQPNQESHIIKQDGLIIPVGKLQDAGRSGLLYDEFIVYDTAQIKMKYLLELEIGNAKRR